MSTTQDERLREIIPAAYANAPEVRARFDAAGIRPEEIQGVADLSRVPVRTKDEVIALQQANPPFGGLLAAPLDQVGHIFFSPGPLYEPAAEDERTTMEMAQLAFQRSGFTAGDVVLNSLSYHLVPAGLTIDRALVEMGCIVVPGGVGNSDLQLKMMGDLRVTAYVGTPSFLMHLIQKAEEMGLDLKGAFKLEKMFATAELFPPALRQTFVEEYGLAVANCYATAELGFLALDTTGQMAMGLLPEPIIQVVDPDTGQTVGPGEVGEVVVTNFSRVYPLVRFGTGDMAVNIDPRPGESVQKERGIILVGRRGEAVKVRGMFVHPNQLRFALGQIGLVGPVQGAISQRDNKDYFTVRVALAGPPSDPAVLVDQIKGQVRSVCRVRVDEVELVQAADLPADEPGMVDERSWS